MKLIDKNISNQELFVMAEKMHGNLVKVVIDIVKKLVIK
jgi:hypothetical protein